MGSFKLGAGDFTQDQENARKIGLSEREMRGFFFFFWKMSDCEETTISFNQKQ